MFRFSLGTAAALILASIALGVFVRGVVDDAREIAAPSPLVMHYAPAENLEAIDVATLDTARRSIDMTAYVLTDAPVIQALARAAKRGVVIRILLDRGMIERRPETSDLIALQDVAGVTVRVKRGFVLMHMKAYEVDATTLRAGSANFSASGLKEQDNELALTTETAAVGRFAATFAKIFDDGLKE